MREDEEFQQGAGQPEGQQPQPDYSGEHSLGDYYYAHSITFKDICEHMTGPVVSVIVHVVLISLLFTMMVFSPPEQKAAVNVEVKEVELKNVENLPEPPPPPEDSSALDESAVQVIDRPSAPAQGVNVDVGDVKVDASSSLQINLPGVMTIKPSAEALKVSSTYTARATTEGRAKLLKTYQADVRNEDSVERALNWLRDNQNPDGTWGSDEKQEVNPKPMLTSFATLAFLAHGEMPSSQKYGECIIKAIKALVDMADKSDSGFIGPGWPPNYNHPITAYTLAEIYGITKIPKVKAAMDKTIESVINGINKNGSYQYGYDRIPYIGERDPMTGKMKKGVHPQPPSDLSFAGWNYQALKSALSAGCDQPGLETAIDLSLKGLRMHCNEKDGGFSLSPGGKQDIGMTSLGILCMGLLGDGDSQFARRSLDWLKKNNEKGLRTCSWQYDKAVHTEYNKAFTHAVYTWYYQTQTLFQASRGQGSLWNNWNKSFSKALIDEQNADGSWLTPAEKYGQSALDAKKDNAEWHYNKPFDNPMNLKTYATAMCCLSLEVYYRYLPTYKLVKETTKKAAVKDDELSF